MLIENLGEVAFAACDVAQPQNGATASRTAVRLDMAAGGGLQNQVERAPIHKQ